MITVSIQIGNSDNKLTQSEWGAFCNEVHALILAHEGQIHFSAPSVGWADWQNAAWVFVIDEEQAIYLQRYLSVVRAKYKQDSLAWTQGETIFI